MFLLIRDKMVRETGVINSCIAGESHDELNEKQRNECRWSRLLVDIPLSAVTTNSNYIINGTKITSKNEKNTRKVPIIKIIVSIYTYIYVIIVFYKIIS